jgi:hypothetical protein
MISSQSSAEDYLWTQALYAAEGAAQLRILEADGGGPAGWVWSDPVISSFITTITGPDLVGGSTTIYAIQSHATRADITRTVEVRYAL